MWKINESEFRSPNINHNEVGLINARATELVKAVVNTILILEEAEESQSSKICLGTGPLSVV